ncbi:MAG: DUF6249 domain-containing protein [Prevotella sp.]|nr:DUF6249 domain-containing protein [Prevotella sp.]
MIRRFLALAIVSLFVMFPITAQSTADDEDEGITLYSDTTTISSSQTHNISVIAGDSIMNFNLNAPLQLFSDLTTIGGTMALGAIVLFFLILLIPLIIIIILIIYFIRHNNAREKAIISAIESGREISIDLLPDVLLPKERLWRKGLKNISIGLGIAVLALFISFKLLAGIGFFIAIYGAWQAVAARTTKESDRYLDSKIKDKEKEDVEP